MFRENIFLDEGIHLTSETSTEIKKQQQKIGMAV